LYTYYGHYQSRIKQFGFLIIFSDPLSLETSQISKIRVGLGILYQAKQLAAGDTVGVKRLASLKLNGEESNNPDANQDLSYLCEQVSPSSPSVSLDGAKNTIATFKAPEVEKDTKFKFELTVNDGKDGKDTDTVIVAVFGSAEEGQEQEQQKEDDGQQPETSSEQLEQEQEQQDDESP